MDTITATDLTALAIILTVGLPCVGLLAASRFRRRPVLTSDTASVTAGRRKQARGA